MNTSSITPDPIDQNFPDPAVCPPRTETPIPGPTQPATAGQPAAGTAQAASGRDNTGNADGCGPDAVQGPIGAVTQWSDAPRQTLGMVSTTESTTAAGSVPVGKSNQPTIFEDLIRLAFGPNTKLEVLSASDPRLPVGLIQSWQGHPDQPDEIAAVECGNESRGLCVLMVPDRPAADQFLKTNAMLAGTLMTTLDDMVFIWMQLSDQPPENTSSADSEWMGSGTALVQTVLSSDSRLPASILTTKAGMIRWPPALSDKFFLNDVLARFGPYYLNNRPKRELNQVVFSILIARSSGLAFDTGNQTFQKQKSEDNTAELVTTPEAIDLVTNCLIKVAADDPVNFPKNELEPPRILSLIERIKLITAFSRPTARESLIKHVRDRVCPKPGGNLTVDEIYSDFLTYTRKHKLSVYPRSQFYVELPAIMLSEKGVLRANDIRRLVPGSTQTTARRGYHGVALGPDGPDVADGPDGPDVPDTKDGLVEKPH